MCSWLKAACILWNVYISQKLNLFPHKHHILTHDFVSVLHLISTEVYQRGQASPSLILWPPRNRQNLHHPCLCQAAVQGQRVQLHGVGSTLQLHNKLIVSWHVKASASYPAVDISSSSEIKLSLIKILWFIFWPILFFSWMHQMTEVSMLYGVPFWVLPALGPSSSKTKTLSICVTYLPLIKTCKL